MILHLHVKIYPHIYIPSGRLYKMLMVLPLKRDDIHFSLFTNISALFDLQISHIILIKKFLKVKKV